MFDGPLADRTLALFGFVDHNRVSIRNAGEASAGPYGLFHPYVIWFDDREGRRLCLKFRAFIDAGAQDVRLSGGDRSVRGGQAHFIVTDERDRATYFEGTSRYALVMPLDSLVQAAGINAPDPYRQIQTFVPVMSAMDPTIVFLRRLPTSSGPGTSRQIIYPRTR